MPEIFLELPIEVRIAIDKMIKGERPEHKPISRSEGVGIEKLFLAGSYYQWRLNNL